MKLTTKSEYALLALVHISRGEEGGVTTQDIADNYDISKKYLEQILIALRRGGYIKSKRGYKGGHMLAKEPGQIHLAEIIRLMDGALAPVDSVSENFFSNTPLEQEEKVLGVFKDIRDYVSEKLENLTIADVN